MQIPLAFLVGAPGGGELLLIFVVVLLMFGPKRLPEMARNIGRAMDYLRRTSQDFRDQMMRLDEEVPKVIDSTIADAKSMTDPTTGLSSEAGDTSSTVDDPWEVSEGEGVASAMSGSDGAVQETEEIKEKEENAGETVSNSEDGGKNVQRPEVSDAGPKDGLAG